MNFLLVALFAIVAVASAVPVHEEHNVFIPILEHKDVRDKYGQYHHRYVSGDGSIVEEKGYLKHFPEQGYVLVKEGVSQYTSPEGQTFVTSFVADEQGYRPHGDHIPKQPHEDEHDHHHHLHEHEHH